MTWFIDRVGHHVVWLATGALFVPGCFDGSPPLDDAQGSGDGSGSSSGPGVGEVTGMPPSPDTTTTTPPGTTTPPADSSDDGPPGTSTGGGCQGDCADRQLDVVFVVDNTVGMAVVQSRLASAAEEFFSSIDLLEAQYGILFDLHVMVTTTDNGNPLCTPFEPKGYNPAHGEPISSPCTERLDHFTSLSGTTSVPEACTDVCPIPIGPNDAYIARYGDDDNVPEGTATEALRCLVPQGINGCGYEQPLETALQALNPGAEWNLGPAPFVRDDADLLIVLATNEADCSVADYGIMADPSVYNTNPDTGMPEPSSGLCWNTGVACDGPDAGGEYSNCSVDDPQGLHSLSRYTDYWLDELAIGQNKRVMMTALAGLPPVTQHSPEPPFEPTAGGIDDLVVRDWIDSPFPAGDISPAEWDQGERAADKAFDFGPGPGCTGLDLDDQFVQAVPPLRIASACQSLDEQGGLRCCLESVCDDQFTGAMNCTAGMLAQDL